jgi:hypothetical protein
MILVPHTDLLPKLELKPGRWTVGSAATCSYRISGRDVQPRHALLWCGRQFAMLRAWDAHTWHNGQPVHGEVRLEPGDRLTVGSVEFSVEAEASSTDDSTVTTPITTAAESPECGVESVAMDDTNGWIALREQIQQLRAEMSQLGYSRSDALSELQNELRDAQEASRANAERVAELERLTTDARSQSEHLSAELLALREDYAQREHSWAEQQANWMLARDQWQQELQSLRDQLQQRTAEWEAHQAEMKAEAARWQSECERLQAELRQYEANIDAERAEWLAEKSRWLGEKSAIELAHQAERDAHARREVEHLNRLQELMDERRQLDELKQQLADAQQALELEQQTLAAERDRLAAELERWRQQTADAQAKAEALARDGENLERERAELAKERQALEHSWNWLHSDRRTIADEKDQWEQLRASWQAEREAWLAEKSQFESDREELVRERSKWSDLQQAQEQLLAERQRLQSDLDQFRNEQASWREELERIETERRTRQCEIEHAELRLRESQRALLEEREQLQIARAELDRRVEEFNRQSASNPQTKEITSPPDDLWEQTLENGQPLTVDADSSAVAVPDAAPDENDESWDLMSDRWNVGVDLTAPRDIHNDRPSKEDDRPNEEQETDREIGSWNASSAPLLPAANSVPESIGDDSSTVTAKEDRGNSSDLPVASSTEPALEQPNAPRDNWPAGPSPTRFTIPSASAGDPNLAALREQLADIFNLPGLESTSAFPPSGSASAASLRLAESEPSRSEFLRDTDRDVEDAAESRDSIFESVQKTENLIESTQNVSEIPEEASPNREDIREETSAEDSVPPSKSPLMELSFSDDEPIEDSVSRYMQLLLARTGKAAEKVTLPGPSDKGNGSSPRLTTQTKSAKPTTLRSNTMVSTQSACTAPMPTIAENPGVLPATPTSAASGSKLSKDVLRNVTEQMRQVANQQTLHNVQASNRNRLMTSLKTKLLLAALAFSLSAGLLYLGYNHKPDFLPLGVCALGLGIMTWLDLFIGIRAARAKTAQLRGRTTQKNRAKA